MMINSHSSSGSDWAAMDSKVQVSKSKRGLCVQMITESMRWPGATQNSKNYRVKPRRAERKALSSRRSGLLAGSFTGQKAFGLFGPSQVSGRFLSCGLQENFRFFCPALEIGGFLPGLLQ